MPAILAALQPENHDYYFYVADPEDQSHVFAETYSEHEANVAAMQEKKEQMRQKVMEKDKKLQEKLQG